MKALFESWWLAAKDFFFSLILSLQVMIKDSFIWIFDQFMSLAVLILSGMGDMFSALDVTQYIEAIPPDVKNIMALIGIGQCMSMVIAAIGIRLILQLIPFVRLGS